MSEEISPAIAAKHSRLLSLSLIICFALLALSGYLFYRLSAQSSDPSLMMTKTPATLTDSPLTVPADAIKISGCIPHEGEHWVELNKLPTGPFYVTDKGRVTAIEYMFTDTSIPGNDFAHKSMPDEMQYMKDRNMNLSGLVKELEQPFILPDVKIKSWSIHWTPPHGGLTIPHYDMHMYLVERNELDSVCPDAPFDNVLPHDVYEQLTKLGVPVPNAGGPDQPQPSPMKMTPTPFR